MKNNFTPSKQYPTINAEHKDWMHIAVIMGGMSGERDVSLSTGKGVVDTLSKKSYRVTPIDMGPDIANILSNLKPDLVFNALHGDFGEDGRLQGLLDIMNLPYTHSKLLACAIGMDKVIAKDIFTSNGFSCAKAVIFDKNNKPSKDPIARPYVIKPVHGGSSLGVQVIFAEDNFDIRDYECSFDDTYMVEEYIPGREIQVAIVDNKAIGVLEIVPKGRFYDYESKYTDGMAEHIYPAKLSEEKTKEALMLAEKAHKLIGAKCVSRVEFRYNDKGDDKFYILEVNTHPGMTPLSIVPEIAAKNGISFDSFLELLIKDALKECNKAQDLV